MAEGHTFPSHIPQVLVTGASGFIATHIIQQLLASGQVKVRGTVRSLKNEAKVAPLYSLVSNPTYPLELVQAELLNEESWIEAVKGCTYVYHVASPLPSSTPQDENEVIQPAVQGTRNVLKACVQAGTVKRVVLTSSLGAISAGLYGEEKEYSELDWSSEQICPPYEKSKLLAEVAAWDFVDNLDEESKFELVAVHPAVVIGPPLTVANGEATALATVKKLLANEMPVLLHLNLPLVDVRDVATAHILAMENPKAAGNRYIISAENRWLKDIAATIADKFRSQGYKIPKWVIPKPGVWILSFLDATVRLVYPIIGKEIRYNNEKMKNELGLEPRDVNTTIIECCYALIELGIVVKERNYQGPSNTSVDETPFTSIEQPLKALETQSKEITNDSKEQPIEVTGNDEQPIENTNEEQPIEGTNNEEQPTKATNKEQPIEATNEEQPIKVTYEEQPIDATNEEQLTEATTSNKEQPIEGTNEEQPIEVSNEEQLIEVTNEEQPIEVINEEQLIEVTNEEQPIEATNEEQPIEATNEEQPIEATNEEQPIEVSNEEQLIEVSNEEKPIEATNKELAKD